MFGFLNADRASTKTTCFWNPCRFFTKTQIQSPDNSRLPLLLSDHIGHYRLDKEIGRGGMGVVYLAWDECLDRWVAIKQMLPLIAADPMNRARFIREAKAMAAVNHDRLIPILTVGEELNRPFIVMPFLVGESLDLRMKTPCSMCVPMALQIGRQVLEGLAAAHQAGLIHRDLKPSNVFIERVLTNGVEYFQGVRVLDFGLARPMQDLLSTRSNVLGTPKWMSPEQHLNQPLEPQTDVFSAGVVLYEMLTGRHPFKTSSYPRLVNSVLSKPHRSARTINPRISLQMSRLLDWMLEKKPSNRPTAKTALLALSYDSLI